MPLQKLQFRPGLNREGTDYANEGGYFDGDKVRFRSGYPEKIGGWSRLSNNQYLGIARSLCNWVAIDGSNYIGVGTNCKYYIEYGDVFNDITPIIHTSTLNNPITATDGSDLITVYDPTYTANKDDYVIISNAIGLGGNITAETLNKEQIVYDVIDFQRYRIRVSATANASDTGNGGLAVKFEYCYPTGADIYTYGTGWGAGPYSRGGWGSAWDEGGLGTQLRLWSNDNYGQDLIIAPRGGEIFYWKQLWGPETRAEFLSKLATEAGYSGEYVPWSTLCVNASSIQRFVIAMGSNPYVPGEGGSIIDPMLVRWSDQENPYQWVPEVTNQAGEYRLSIGSYIMTYRNTRQEILIWTDSALYSMQYLGPPYVWGFNILMDNISIISPNAAITVNNVTYWMGLDKFYMYSGRVETLPCSLRQFVFDDINVTQSFQVFCGSNEGYNEVWWFYCSKDSNVVDRYVIYNYLDRVWYYGTMNRTAWLDSGLRRYPFAADYNRRLLYHESAVDDVSGLTPQPIVSYVQSSDFDIGDGHNFGFVWRILPDVNFNGSNVDKPYVTMTVRPRENSGTPYGPADSPEVQSLDNYSTSRQYTVQQFDGQVYTRLRGRQLAFRIQSDSLGVAWQLGTPRIDIRNDGRR